MSIAGLSTEYFTSWINYFFSHTFMTPIMTLCKIKGKSWAKIQQKIVALTRKICPICVNGVIRISINMSFDCISKVEMLLCIVEIDSYSTMNNAVPWILILIHWHLLVRASPVQVPPPPAPNVQNKSITHRLGLEDLRPPIHSTEDVMEEFCGRISSPVERRGWTFRWCYLLTYPSSEGLTEAYITVYISDGSSALSLYRFWPTF